MTEKVKTGSFEAFVAVIDRLRSPGGCPWDLEQTHESIRQATLEEAYEAVHAIDLKDAGNLKEELGDLLLHVVFHADIAKRNGTFTIDDVVTSISEKMIRRHPHVFGTVEAENAEAVVRNWEELKKQERAAKGSIEPPSILDSVHRHVPAVMEAQSLSEKAARVGFDWKTADDVRAKIEEELEELAAARSGGASGPEIEGEVGDLLFAVVNLARKVGVDPEAALRATNRKFRGRFGFVEARLRDRGRSPKDSTLEEMEGLWQAAKKCT